MAINQKEIREKVYNELKKIFPEVIMTKDGLALDTGDSQMATIKVVIKKS
jgi:hypothetical protein